MRALLSVIMLAAILWSGCFVWFIRNLPDVPATNDAHTDAIIVLTGGNGRVERGLEVLSSGAAPRILITGVGQHVTLWQLLRAHATPLTRSKIDELQPEIVLDYAADSTQTNAEQGANFVLERELESIRLVTASYHMPRSMLEFRNTLPGVNIIADPVFPPNFHRYEWWQHDTTRRLVLSEFHKYFAAMILRTRLNIAS